MFALQAGLAEVWKSAGVTPDLLIGHSFGEVTAAYLAGAIALADVAHLVNHRGLIRGHIDRVGGMAAIGMGARELAAFMPDDGSVEIGAYNSPSMVTVSGERAAIEALIVRLKAHDPNMLARLLDLDFAWHSSWLEPGKDIFLSAVGEQPWHSPRIPVISTVTGEFETRFDTHYWWRNLRYPVRFDKAVDLALDEGATRFIELGPSRTLSSPAASCAAAKARDGRDGDDAAARAGQFRLVRGRAGAALRVGRSRSPGSGFTRARARRSRCRACRGCNEHLWKAPEEATHLLFAKPSHALLGRPRARPRPSLVEHGVARRLSRCSAIIAFSAPACCRAPP